MPAKAIKCGLLPGEGRGRGGAPDAVVAVLMWGISGRGRATHHCSGYRRGQASV